MMNKDVEPMRIAYLVNQYPAVSHSFIRREILELERSGVDVVRIALLGWAGTIVDDADRRELERTFYIQKLGLVRLCAGWCLAFLSSPWRMLQAVALVMKMARHSSRAFAVHCFYLVEACAVADVLKRRNVHHVHAHFGTNSAEVAMLACCLSGRTYSFTAHGPEEFDKAGSIGLVTKVRRSAFVVAVSSFGRGQLYRWIDPGDWSKVKVVHCGLEPGFHNHVPTLRPAERRLVCVGRLCEQKGQLLLIRAAEMLARRGVAFHLVLAGDGELRAELEREIAARELGDRVTITGWLSSTGIRDELLKATALVLPSLAEGLPVAIMEAMALRRPVLSTYVAGIPELVSAGVNGWLVPSGCTEALAAAMESCLSASPAEIERMGNSAQQVVLARHDIASETRKLVGHFVQVVGERKHAIGG
jgi:colanic acid/amylovoran biosynthesis glycosyltransferase